MVVSSTSCQQHHLESSTGQQELLSSINNMVVLQHSALGGRLASSKSLQREYPRRLPFFTARWTQKQVFQFVFFDILFRTNHLRQHEGLIKDKKQLRQAWSILLRFRPSTLLAWLVETVVILDMSWGNTVDGLKINPRFYVQIPDSHQVMKAARTGNMSLIQKLINMNIAPTLCMTSAGWTPLHVSFKFLEQRKKEEEKRKIPLEADPFLVCCCQRSPRYV